MRIDFVPSAAFALALIATGCAGPQLKEMQQQVNQEQVLIERQQRELDELRAQQQQQAANTMLPPPGSCDPAVMRDALRLGDGQYGSGKYQLALGYYQDAEKACPHNGKVELSLARVYEALGDRTEARRHYQLALDAAEAGSADAEQARQGMGRSGSQ
jgi:tetratricopeptide (TPR) repeat protein